MKSKNLLQKLLGLTICLALTLSAVFTLNFTVSQNAYADATTYKKIAKYTFNTIETMVNEDDNTDTKSLTITRDEEKSAITNDDGTKINITNTEPSATKVSTDTLFSAKQGYNYKVTINLRSNLDEGNGYLRLFSATDSKQSEITISSNTTDTNFSFYVLGSPLKDYAFKLDMELGKSGATSKGTITVSSIEIGYIDYSVYSNASTTNNAKLALYKDITISATSNYLSNGCFDSFEIEDAEKIYPAKAKEFTITKGSSDTQVIGVVNTDADNFNKFLIDSALPLSNPMDSKNNNLMLLYNTEADTVSITSKETTLSKDSYYIIGYDYLNINNATIRLSLITTVDGNEVELAGIIISGTQVTSNDNPAQKLYIHTADSSISVKLKLTMTTTDAGYAFIDNAQINYAIDQRTAKTNYNSFVESNPTSSAKADLTNHFYSTIIDGESIVPNFISNDENVKIEGVAITDLDDTSEGIKISTDTYSNFAITAKWSDSLTSNSYYKYEFDAKTNNLSHPETASNVEMMGGTIRLTNLNTQFEAINTDGAWAHYTFYIKTDDAKTTYIRLGLGDETCLTSGEFYLANAKLTKLDDFTESNFNEIQDSATTKKVLPTIATEEDHDHEDNQETTDKYAWIRYVSILVFPIIIIGVILFLSLKSIYKKIDRDRPKMKNKKSSYDRSHTLSVQEGSQKATSIREKQLVELTNSIKSLKQEKLEQENIYKQQLKELRELKKKSNSKKEIATKEKATNATKRLSNLINKIIDKQNKKIDKIKSDEYIKKLTKKCSAEINKQAKKKNK